MTIFINIIPNTHYAPYTLRITLSETPSLEVKKSIFFVARRPATKKKPFFFGGTLFLGGSGKGRGILRPKNSFFGRRSSPLNNMPHASRDASPQKKMSFFYSLANMLENPCAPAPVGSYYMLVAAEV